jgi:DNA-binding beta-propeller fold protein YncE
MDENALRELLDRVIDSEPPIGSLARNSLHAGIMRRRRRRAASAAMLSAVAVVLVGTVPALTGAFNTRPAGHRDSKATAYVATVGDIVIPVNLATNRAGRPVKVPAVPTMVAATPDGRTVYVLCQTGQVTPISTATNKAGQPISLPGHTPPYGIAFTPNSKTAYVAVPTGVIPIDTATSSPLKPIDMPVSVEPAIAITPDGRTAYEVTDVELPGRVRMVTPINTATNTALKPIKLQVSSKAPDFLNSIAITPNGKTAYIVDGVQEGKPYSNSVSPIRTATNTALKPIKLRASGLADGIVITPDSRTAYVLSSRAVTPINTATNTALKPINLPASVGYAYLLAITPDGKTIYVLSPTAVTPIRTATNTTLAPIRIKGLNRFGALAITPDGTTVYVGARNGIVPIDTATGTVGHYIDLSANARPGRPFSIAFTR